MVTIGVRIQQLAGVVKGAFKSEVHPQTVYANKENKDGYALLKTSAVFLG